MKNRKMPKGGRNLEKVLFVINYCSYVEFLEVAILYKKKRNRQRRPVPFALWV
ncbi:MAG: hypothetical protein IKR18_10655 [Bacteroidaceae bacterium]|nr:hypothetical protein [Bacteroidaceae bacterium]